MSALSIAPQPGEPLAAWFSTEERAGSPREQRFECSSHGDRVSGRCWWPDGAASALVLALHDLGRDQRDPALALAARRWAAAGWATAAIDLPLHGERHNAKLAPRAVAGRAANAGADRALWLGLAAQALRDLARALDALATRGPLPRVACAAFGDSAPLAHALAGLDPRVRDAFAIGAPRPLAGDLAPAGAKPLVWLARPDDLVLAR